MSVTPGVAGGRLLTLAVGGKRFAVSADIVREVARMPRLVRVPNGPPALIGLANIRGAVVPVLSLASLLECPLPDHSGGEARRVVIVDDGEVLGLAVDEVPQLVDADAVTGDAMPTLDIAAMVASNLPARAPAQARSAASTDEQAAEVRAGLMPLVIFAIGTQEFAFPLDIVDEVRRVPTAITVMPLSDAVVIGTAAVRGMLLPLLSLRALLALPGTDDRARGRVLVVRIGTHRVGLLVDAMRSIVQVHEDAIDPVPHVLVRGGGEARLHAIGRLDGGERLVSILAANRLVRDDITAGLFRGTGEQGISEAATDERFEQFLLFRIGQDDFALPIAAVEEVAMLPNRLTRLPVAPAFVQGVMNLRGRAIAVIDQAARFGTVAAARPGRRGGSRGGGRRVVIVRVADVSAGFVVDAVSDVLRVPEGALHPAPDMGTEGARVFDRVADVADGRMVLIVSPRELLDRTEQDLLLGMTAKAAIA